MAIAIAVPSVHSPGSHTPPAVIATSRSGPAAVGTRTAHQRVAGCRRRQYSFEPIVPCGHVAGHPLQRDWFRRTMEPQLTPTGTVTTKGRGRPAEVFRRPA